ncbi:MAG: DUF2203 family protein [Deltaproteobacteria bacterium]|nr:MAG: DUF2203 family protein [Deltaproteobacteria bacterium]
MDVAHQTVSLDEANARLPLLRPLVASAMKIHAQLRPLVARLEQLDIDVDRRLLNGKMPDDADRSARFAIGRVQGLYAALRDLLAEIEDLGAELKDLETGLVDFRSYLDGREEVYLCWRMGEPTIGHYHGLAAGYAGRRPVTGLEFSAEPSSAGRRHA